jgi:WD40 repeat protein
MEPQSAVGGFVEGSVLAMTGRISAAFSAAVVTALAAICLCLGVAGAQERPEVFPQLGHSQGVFSLAFSPDGNTLATGSADNTVKFWDVPSRREIRTLGPGLPAISMAFSPDGHFLAIGLVNQKIKLVDAVSGAELHTLSGHAGIIASVAFSPDGRILASASDDRTVKLWDVASGAEITTLGGFSHSVLSVAFSPDGRLLAANSADRTIRLWDLTSGRELGGIKDMPLGSLLFRRTDERSPRGPASTPSKSGMLRADANCGPCVDMAITLPWSHSRLTGVFWLLELRQNRQVLGRRERTRSRQSHRKPQPPIDALGHVHGVLADGT